MSIVETEDRGAVRHVVLNRPEKRNAFNAELVLGLGEAMGAAADDSEVRVVVLRGAGPMFSSGVDLGGAASLADSPASLRAFRRPWIDVCNLIEAPASGARWRPRSRATFASSPATRSSACPRRASG